MKIQPLTAHQAADLGAIIDRHNENVEAALKPFELLGGFFPPVAAANAWTKVMLNPYALAHGPGVFVTAGIKATEAGVGAAVGPIMARSGFGMPGA
ncbi:MAG: hypothetical protein AAFQ82_17955 [Myxococcota bacterium]